MLLGNEVLGLLLTRLNLLIDFGDRQMIFGIIRFLKRLLWLIRNDRVHGNIGVVASTAPCSELVFGEARVELFPGYEWLVLLRHL